MRTRVKPRTKRQRLVRKLAGERCNLHTIAAHLDVGVNRLRREHALDLDAARRKRASEKAAAAAVSKEQRERIALIEMALNSHWTTPEHGCLLYGGARTVAEALEWLGGPKMGR
jgi:hypothetical protein